MPFFRHEGHRLAYTVRGSGPRVVVLLPGLLFSQRMHAPLARALAERDNRVITLDLLGHGRSDRPKDMWKYSMTTYGEEVVALLDHLDIDEAVVGGTSLGANTTLEVAALAPERLRGMVVEMPVLDNALLGCAIAFTPLMIALTFGEPAMKVVQAAAKSVPSRFVPFWGDIGLDWVRQDPAPSAALLQGLFFGRVAPHRTLRKTFETPALVIGHRRDPVHPFSDAGMLVDELPNGRLVEADSFFELRFTPDRLTSEIADFIDECWKPKRAKRPPARRSSARRRGAA
jgi:pimeloyl-ACP methyl ester carboxylesterase